jgi:hypothetical protein
MGAWVEKESHGDSDFTFLLLARSLLFTLSQTRIADLEAEIEELTKAKAMAEMQRDRMERSWRTVETELAEERKAFKAQIKGWEDVANHLRDQLVRTSVEAGRKEIDKNAAASLCKEAKSDKENGELAAKLRSDASKRSAQVQGRLALD